MKKALKIIACAAAAPVFWALLLLVFLRGWIDLSMRQQVVKYERTGYPQGCILLAGSSTMQMWQTSARDLGPLDTVNVGVSGAVVRHWLDYADKLIYPFAPEAVVLYLGANDLHAEKQSPEAVMENLTRLFDEIRGNLPETEIYFVSVYTPGAYADSRADDEALNGMVRELARNTDGLGYIDCATPLLTDDGAVRDDVFQSDLVHLNEDGNRILAEAVRQTLSKEMTK
jgi:lysophospholipase L1-like esterase